MSILRVSFFLFVFLFHSFVFSEPVVEVSEKAETVFTDFVINLLSEIDNSEAELDKFKESNLLEDIARATENWTVDEAREFLSILQSSGIAPSSILNILLSTDYIKALKERPAFGFSTESTQLRQERLTAGEVFFNYVDERLGASELEDRMGSEWLTLILTDTQDWTDIDATDFLNFLEFSEVQLESILSLLQATDYLQKLKSGQMNLSFLNTSNVEIVKSTSPAINHQQSVLQSTISSQSASDIFIERARQYFRLEFEEQQSKKYKNMTYEEAFQKKMGVNWEDRIQEYTNRWTSEDATAFLDYLSNRIGEITTLNRIKYPSYFQHMQSYNRFLEFISFYESYIGEDGVTYRLSKSLKGFERGDFVEIRRVIKFLEEEYLGNQEDIKVIMMKNLDGFSILSSKPSAQTSLKNLKDVIAYLKSIGITEVIIKSKLVDNFVGFVKATREKLETKGDSLTKPETIGIAFTSSEVNQMIVENMQGFLGANLKKVKKMVTYLKDKDTGPGLEDQQIKDMAISNLKGLALSDPQTLEDKRQSLTKPETIGIALTSSEVNQMIAESIQAFLDADLKKVKKMVTYLKDKDTGPGLEDQQIKDMAISNLKGLALSDPQTLEDKRQSLTKPETVGITFSSSEVNQMIAESIEGFLRADLKKVKKMVTYLKDKDTGPGLEDQQIKDMAISNLKGLALSDPQTLEDKRQSLTKPEAIGIAFTSSEVNQMIAESIEGFLQADLKKSKENGDVSQR